MTPNGERTWPNAAEWTGKINSEGRRTPEGDVHRVTEPATGTPPAQVDTPPPGCRTGRRQCRAGNVGRLR